MKKDSTYQFQVDLKGMIALLSEHIYSSPTVFIRELLQNGMDAVTVRKGIDVEFVGRLDIFFEGQNRLVFQDNGIGLTEQDVHQFLSVIGQSSKRGALVDKDLIGKFGIGLLSCLVVSETIIVESRALYGGPSVRWVGRADGTYEVSQMESLPEVGTRVILEAKTAWASLFEREQVKQQLLFYGSALPIAVYMHQDGEVVQLLDGNPIWMDSSCSKEDLLAYGKTVFKTRFLDVFRLQSEAGALCGVAYVLPHKVNASTTKEHKIFLKRMYLGEQATNLLPEWTSFVRCIFNTNTLQPTASRESLMNTPVLQQTKKELSTCFKDYLKVLALTDVKTLQQLISVHHLYIKALAATDMEIMDLFADYLPFETNQGVLSFEEIKTNYQPLYYTPSLDDFRQIRRIAGSQHKLVINAAYSYETDLIEKLKRRSDSYTLELLVPQDILDEFDEAVELDQTAKNFLIEADKYLKPYHCKATIKRFEPLDTPALYIATEQAVQAKNIQSFEQTSNPFASALQHLNPKEVAWPTLCFNQQNDLVSKLLLLDDEVLLEAFVKVMYVQALMLGGYTINKREMTVFNDALYQLLIMGMSNFLPNF